MTEAAAHAHAVTGAELVILRHLIGSEDLQEGRLGLGIRQRRLGRQVAEGGGGLLDPAGIVILDGGIQSLARGSHAGARRHIGGYRSSENRGCRLLLRRGQRQKCRQTRHLTCRHTGRSGRSMRALSGRGRALSEYKGSGKYGSCQKLAEFVMHLER